MWGIHRACSAPIERLRRASRNTPNGHDFHHRGASCTVMTVWPAHPVLGDAAPVVAAILLSSKASLGGGLLENGVARMIVVSPEGSALVRGRVAGPGGTEGKTESIASTCRSRLRWPARLVGCPLTDSRPVQTLDEAGQPTHRRRCASRLPAHLNLARHRLHCTPAHDQSIALRFSSFRFFEILLRASGTRDSLAFRRVFDLRQREQSPQ